MPSATSLGPRLASPARRAEPLLTVLSKTAHPPGTRDPSPSVKFLSCTPHSPTRSGGPLRACLGPVCHTDVSLKKAGLLSNFDLSLWSKHLPQDLVHSRPWTHWLNKSPKAGRKIPNTKPRLFVLRYSLTGTSQSPFFLLPGTYLQVTIKKWRRRYQETAYSLLPLANNPKLAALGPRGWAQGSSGGGGDAQPWEAGSTGGCRQETTAPGEQSRGERDREGERETERETDVAVQKESPQPVFLHQSLDLRRMSTNPEYHQAISRRWINSIYCKKKVNHCSSTEARGYHDEQNTSFSVNSPCFCH